MHSLILLLLFVFFMLFAAIFLILSITKGKRISFSKLLGMFCFAMSGVVLLVATGCGTNVTSEMENEKKLELTEDQVQILVSAGSGEDRVRSGELTGVDEKILEEYAFALDYLEKKYGGIDLTLDSCTPSGQTGTYTSFYGAVEQAPDEVFEVVLEESDGGMQARDSCYGILMRDEYVSFLESLLADKGETCLGVEMTISGLYGEDYDMELLPGKAMEQGMYLKAIGSIELDGSGMTDVQCEERLDEIKNYLADNGVTGSFQVNFTGSDGGFSQFIHIFEA